MIVVLVVAAGAAWESPALRVLGDDPGIVVLKRCVDVDDLLATATVGQADVAVVGLDAPGLDGPAVDHLLHHDVRPVAVVPDGPDEAARLRAGRLGIRTVVGASDVAGLPEAVLGAAHDDDGPPTARTAPHDPDAVPPGAPDVPPGRPGRVLAVWGPPGAPGRSTVAAGVAAELARRGRRVLLVDADTHAASQAQQLGVLDEVSGLLAAARLAGTGHLEDEVVSVQRALDARLAVVTGLPRPDRWREVRAGVVETLLRAARRHGDVVVDTAAPIEGDPGPDLSGRGGRNQATTEALGAADEVLVVGAADPVGLARLARALVELRETVGPVGVRVLVNRMRPGLGWSENEVAAMVADFGRITSLHFLPHDLAAVDRALVAGRTLVEGGDSALLRALAAVVDAVEPGSLTQHGAQHGAQHVGQHGDRRASRRGARRGRRSR
ncbi:AAA family ATPase [Nocardioides sp. AX2bis]|uniref:AAA family ATPase n=1 Tax=Nocardioides sp. AX2bis TaxID=2653157 RepID=UPI0012EFFF53|nr:hypothetical protein [Nocardioides sp. AX2bis]VXB93740.1 Pilus biosynthesis protein CpaE [Nocardioides sp. AX2bis]